MAGEEPMAMIFLKHSYPLVYMIAILDQPFMRYSFIYIRMK